MRRIGAALAINVAAMMLVSVDAAAQVKADVLATCASNNPRADAREKVRACTEAIESGTIKRKTLGSLFLDRAAGHERLGAWNAALADFEAAVRLTPAESFRARGQFYLRRLDYKDAIADFDRAANMTRNQNPEDLGMRCGARAMAGVELRTAKLFCDEALALRPGNPPLLEMRGLLRLKLGLFAQAWDDYALALRWRPESAPARYGLGVAAIGLGRDEEGRNEMAKAVASDAAVARRFEQYGVAP
jgi:tetratricopeptide (TPR) repeat protein